IGLLHDVETHDAGLEDAVTRIFDRGLSKRLDEIGIHSRVNMNNQHGIPFRAPKLSRCEQMLKREFWSVRLISLCNFSSRSLRCVVVVPPFVTAFGSRPKLAVYFFAILLGLTA